MSMVSHLNEEYMEAWCPCCGKTCSVWESDCTRPATDDTPAEYEAHCSECGQDFYVSTEY